MSLSFSVLSSSSKGNCTLVVAGQTKILLDCGISAKQVDNRLTELGFNPAELDAVLISHEHSDHLKGLKVLSSRYSFDIFCSSKLVNRLSGLPNLNAFSSVERFSIGSCQIEPIPISHDATDPLAFTFSYDGKKLCHVTDLGFVTDEIIDKLKGLDALVLESNYEPDMLENAPYPWHTKERIKGEKGHLSNSQAGEIVQELANLGEEPQVIVAAHISENSNTKELALSNMEKAWDSGSKNGFSPLIRAGSFYESTELFAIESSKNNRNK